MTMTRRPGIVEGCGYASVSGASLYYDAVGVGEPVVLAHGFSLDSRMWDGQVGPWSQHRQVIRYDLRGFGRSSRGDEPYTHADDLMGLIRHLGLSRVTVVGLSLGGGAAINFALSYPEALRALVVVDSSLGGFSFSQEFAAAQTAVRAAAQEGGLAAARTLWMSSPLFSRAMAIPRAATALRTMVSGYSGWHWLNQDAGRAMSPPAISRLREIHVPTLIVVGELDIPDFHKVAATLRREIAGAKCVVVAGAGHLPNLESPDFFNSAVLQFLDAEDLSR
jgi:pimeloyl-ACP methyl ester carboxylesterase